MKYTPSHIEAEHVIITGPITGSVTLDNGEVIDVTQPVIAVRDEAHAAEVAHAIGQHWAQPENIHPGQVNRLEDGSVEVLDFVYDDSHHKAAAKSKKKG